MKKDRMVIFKGEQDICDTKKVGELARVFKTFIGIPSTKCPIGNITNCNGPKDKIQLTSVKKVLELFAGSVINFETRSRHNTVSEKPKIFLAFSGEFSSHRVNRASNLLWKFSKIKQ
jgi:hypothetical protein